MLEWLDKVKICVLDFNTITKIRYANLNLILSCLKVRRKQIITISAHFQVKKLLMVENAFCIDVDKKIIKYFAEKNLSLFEGGPLKKKISYHF